MAQEWRYYSREKSLIHTLHLTELVTGSRGDTILIAPTPPVTQTNLGNAGGFSVPSLQLPTQGNGIVDVTFTKNVLSTVFGAVGINKQILCQKGVIIQFSRWDSQQMRFLMTVQDAGWYFVYVEGQSDLRDPSQGYFGPFDPSRGGQSQEIGVGANRQPYGFSATTICGEGSGIYQQGPMDGSTSPLHWGPNLYITTTHVTRAHGVTDLGAGETVEFIGSFLGNAPAAYVSGYLFKMSDL